MQMTVNRILCLLAVDILGDKSFGITVANLIVTHTNGHETLRRGVYVTLHKMVDMGWMRKLVAGDKTPRPFYRLTKRGRTALETQMQEFENLGKLYRKYRAKRLKKT